MTREVTKTWEKRAPWDKSNHYIICAVLYSDTLRVVDDLSSILSLFASFSFLPEYHNYNSNHNNQLYCYVTLVRSPVGCGSEMDIDVWATLLLLCTFRHPMSPNTPEWHRVKYGLDYFLDHFLGHFSDHFLDHFFGLFFGTILKGGAHH